MTIASRLQQLGITLPAPIAAIANYVPYTRQGNLLVISGQITIENGEKKFIGQLGKNISLEEGQKAARLCAVNVIAQISAALDGDLERVERILRLGVFVSCTPEFTEHSQVANGASDLMVDVFGDAGRHARAAVGVSSLPVGVSVEVEALVALKN